MTIDLTGQRVLVVGAAGGVGRATTETFAAMARPSPRQAARRRRWRRSPSRSLAKRSNLT
jgi:NAD(P)-dependent dehydrogenase (short-subunit alcohol dehydrogenase family)